MGPFEMLTMVRAAEWQTNVAGLDDIVSILAVYIQEDKFDFVFSLCDALLSHDLSTYPAFYRATFQVYMARSQPDDSDLDAEDRLKIAKALLEEDDENSKELWDELRPRVEKMLELVNHCLQHDLSDCPSPGHPDFRDTQKLYPGMEGWGVEVEDSEDLEPEEAEDDQETVEQETEEPDCLREPTIPIAIDVEEISD